MSAVLVLLSISKKMYRTVRTHIMRMIYKDTSLSALKILLMMLFHSFRFHFKMFTLFYLFFLYSIYLYIHFPCYRYIHFTLCAAFDPELQAHKTHQAPRSAPAHNSPARPCRRGVGATGSPGGDSCRCTIITASLSTLPPLRPRPRQ